MDIEKLSELRGMNKPIIDIEELMMPIIMICKSLLCELHGMNKPIIDIEELMMPIIMICKL